MKLATRSSYGRSRNGCNTCKIRHVKCDERKPNCLRCSSTGRNCDGYAPSMFPKLNNNCSLDLPGSRKERRAFDFFRSCTVPSLCSYFSEDFWEYEVLQASFEQPALRHAAIALGSYHEALSGGSTPLENFFALGQYTKALSQLRNSIARDREQHLVALMSCVLFVCFDSFRGQLDAALIHLRNGLQILHSCPSMDSLFYRVFVRLGLQAMFFVDARTLNTNRQAEHALHWTVLSKYLDIPLQFTSLIHARNVLTEIFDGAMHYFYGDLKSTSIEVPGDVQTWRDIERLPRPDSQQAEVVVRLKSWGRAFDAFLKHQRLKLTSRDLRGATMLKIHHYVAMDMLHSKLAWMTPLDFIENYKRIISLCQSLVNAELSRNAMDLSYDFGIVPVLYFVGMNCRVIHIRLQALEMLEATPRREGMWDSRTASLIIRRAMALEEMASLHHQDWELKPSHEEKSALSVLDDMKASPGKWLVYSHTPREAMEELKLEVQNRAGVFESSKKSFP